MHPEGPLWRAAKGSEMVKYRKRVLFGFLATTLLLAFIGARQFLDWGSAHDEARTNPVHTEPADAEEIAEPAEPAEPTDLASESVTARPDPINNGIAAAPLPDPTLPLIDQLDALKTRSKHGDSRAACRLALSSARCRGQLRMAALKQNVSQQLESGSSHSESLMIALAAANDEDMQLSEGYCAGVRKDDLPRPDELIAQQLHLFSASQKTVLALMQSNGELRRLDARRSFSESALYVYPQFQADHAYAFLLEGYAAKEPLALEGLILVHAPGSLLAPQSVGVWLPDPKRFLHYVFVMQLVYGENSVSAQVQRLAQASAFSISPEELKQARSSAEIDAKQWQNVSAHRGSQRAKQRDEDVDICN